MKAITIFLLQCPLREVYGLDQISRKLARVGFDLCKECTIKTDRFIRAIVLDACWYCPASQSPCLSDVTPPSTTADKTEKHFKIATGSKGRQKRASGNPSILSHFDSMSTAFLLHAEAQRPTGKVERGDILLQDLSKPITVPVDILEMSITLASSSATAITDFVIKGEMLPLEKAIEICWPVDEHLQNVGNHRDRFRKILKQDVGSFDLAGGALTEFTNRGFKLISPNHAQYLPVSDLPFGYGQAAGRSVQAPDEC
ncbi:hypothetical protein HDV05_003527 [Chytridiales sp. JEL 0842]|nr:hypothetical protein HDV05_003527 [Chytridiales sp. JEL 0842]